MDPPAGAGETEGGAGGDKNAAAAADSSTAMTTPAAATRCSEMNLRNQPESRAERTAPAMRLSSIKEIGRGLPSIDRILRQATPNELVDAGRQRWDELANRCRLLCHDGRRQARTAPPFESFLPTEHLVEHATKGKQIRARVRWQALELLGGHVVHACR